MPLVHLHGVAQCARGAGDDGDLLHRGRVGLLGRHKGMADLVVGYDALFVVGQDGVLLLVAGNDHLDALLKVGLRHALAPCPHGTQSSFIYNVGQLCAGGTGGHACHGVEVHTRGDLHFLACTFKISSRPFRSGSSTGTRRSNRPGRVRGRVEGIRAVGSRQNDDTGVALKAVHLGKQLVQGLLALVVAAKLAAVALLANGVNFINEYDAGAPFPWPA